jgi:hypothetical protein
MSTSSSFEFDDYMLKGFTLLPLIQSQSSNILSYYISNQSKKHRGYDNIEHIYLAQDRTQLPIVVYIVMTITKQTMYL